MNREREGNFDNFPGEVGGGVHVPNLSWATPQGLLRVHQGAFFGKVGRPNPPVDSVAALGTPP